MNEESDLLPFDRKIAPLTTTLSIKEVAVPVSAMVPVAPTYSLAVQEAVDADYVVHYRSRRRRTWRLWGRFLYRVVTALIFTAIFLTLPDFHLDALHTWKNPIVTFIAVCAVGKILVDTLFYDHYLP